MEYFRPLTGFEAGSAVAGLLLLRTYLVDCLDHFREGTYIRFEELLSFTLGQLTSIGSEFEQGDDRRQVKLQRFSDLAGRLEPSDRRYFTDKLEDRSHNPDETDHTFGHQSEQALR
jgi:hypothetical protein